jgi:hypothetical protein
MNREELLFAFQAIASQAKYQGNPQARQICEKLTNIMSDRLTIISRSGQVFEMGDCWQVLLVRGAPTKIAVARPDMI